MDSPSPCPGRSWLARKKGSKARRAASGPIPMPLSLTASRTVGPSSTQKIFTWQRRSFARYLIALPRRFPTICPRTSDEQATCTSATSARRSTSSWTGPSSSSTSSTAATTEQTPGGTWPERDSASIASISPDMREAALPIRSEIRRTSASERPPRARRPTRACTGVRGRRRSCATRPAKASSSRFLLSTSCKFSVTTARCRSAARRRDRASWPSTSTTTTPTSPSMATCGRPRATSLPPMVLASSWFRSMSRSTDSCARAIERSAAR